MSEAKRPRKRRQTFISTFTPLGVGVLIITALLNTNASAVSKVDDAPVLLTEEVMLQSPMSLAETEEIHSQPATPSAASPSLVLPSRNESAEPAGQPSRVVYEAAGIDLPVQMMNQVDGPFVPPESKEFAYWLTQRPGYLLAHSAELEKWPFNALTTAARIGDVITLTAPSGNVSYKVTDVTSYPKHYLETDGKTPVWDIDHRLLRLIGCKDGDVWGQVTVVTATMQ